jgi:hypothetical protein
MSAEEHQRWLWETHLKQLVIAEAEAWRRFAWGAGIYFGLLLLVPLGILLAGASITDHAKSTRPEGIWIVGLMLQVLGAAAFYLIGFLVLRRFIRWIKAMRQRRRFSSTPGADPGQLQRQ